MTMLEKIRFRDYGNGIDVQAFTDGYAHDEHSYLYLLSVAGHDSNVKAITSALVSGRSIEIMSEPVIEAVPSYGQKYRIMSSRLPGTLLHQVVASEGFFGSPDGPVNLLYVDGEDPARLVYEAVRSGYPVPAIPEWSGWLYGKLIKEGHVHELKGTKKVLRLALDEEGLDSMISDAVGSGEISF
jgi:hypothetical protein